MEGITFLCYALHMSGRAHCMGAANTCNVMCSKAPFNYTTKILGVLYGPVSILCLPSFVATFKSGSGCNISALGYVVKGSNAFQCFYTLLLVKTFEFLLESP
jgi:hypothetical protein